MLSVPDLQALDTVAAELERTVASAAIRLLDLVIVEVDDHGAPVVLEADSVPALDAIRGRSALNGVLLSRHDLDLVALALQPGDRALILVAEDRWAEPLSVAARAAGGEVRAGERIARERVEAALANVARSANTDDEGGRPCPR